MAKNTVVLKDFLKIFEEYVAAGVITPGMLIEYTSAGTVQAHSTAGGNVLTMLALEDELQGNDLDDDYAVGDPVQCWIPMRGAVAYMMIADGEDVSIGDLLESDGAGKLQVHVADNGGKTTPNQIVAQALEAVGMSGSSAADPTGRIEVRIV
jgi:hypothetical protein